MYNLILADLYKLRKSMIIKLLFASTTISAVLMVVMAYMITQDKVEPSMTGIGFMFSDINMISILGAAIAGILICGDFDNKTIHDAIASGCSRGAVIITKSIIFCSALAIILIPYMLITLISLGTGLEFNMGSEALGFLYLLTSEAGTVISISEVWRLLLIILTLTILYIAQLSVCLPLALTLKKPVLVLAIYYGFSILSGQLMRIKGTFPVFDRIFAFTPYGSNHIFITLDTGIGDIFTTIIVSLLYLLIMIVISYCIFRKMEIK